MRADQFRALFNIVASTLAEAGEAPEGILYAGLMHAGINLADYERIRAVLVGLDLATVEPGPVLKATAKLMNTYRLALSKPAGRSKELKTEIPGGDSYDARLP